MIHFPFPSDDDYEEDDDFDDDPNAVIRFNRNVQIIVNHVLFLESWRDALSLSWSLEDGPLPASVEERMEEADHMLFFQMSLMRN